MAYVPIPKDLNRVKTKVAFNLTKRQLIGFSLAGIVGFPIYLGVRTALPNDIAIIMMITATLPIFFVTMFDKDGLRAEKYFKYIYSSKIYQPRKRVRKEVYIEQSKDARSKARKKKKGLKKAEKRCRKS